jgi:2-methylcitrate dehydratase
MVVHEDSRFTARFLDPAVRSCANGIQITYRDGTMTRRIDIEQPVGHARRRAEGMPYFERKLRHNLALGLSPQQTTRVLDVFSNRDKCLQMSVTDFLELFIC